MKMRGTTTTTMMRWTPRTTTRRIQRIQRTPRSQKRNPGSKKRSPRSIRNPGSLKRNPRSQKKRSKKFNEEHEDSDMDDMDSDMDYYGDGYADYAPAPRFRSPAYRRYKKRSVGMDSYGYDGYPDYARKKPSRKYRPSRKPRPSYMQSLAGQKRRRKNKHMRAKKYYYM